MDEANNEIVRLKADLARVREAVKALQVPYDDKDEVTKAHNRAIDLAMHALGVRAGEGQG